jgi:hypothetical protein
MLFPINLHLRLRWRYISRLQFKAKGPNFHAELVPVHSPLLRESYLVSYPPLTYMLKFSGFADLTSCSERSPKSGATSEKPQAGSTTKSTSKMFSQLCANECPHTLHASGDAPRSSTLTHRNAASDGTARRWSMSLA